MGQKQTFVTGLADYNTVNRDGLGTIRAENNAVYKYVQFTGTTAVNVGDAVCYVVAASDGQAQIVDNANTAIGAGVSMVAVPTGTVAYGWIQIKGLAILARAFGGPPVAGNSLTSIGAAIGVLQVASVLTNSLVAVCYDVTNRKALLDYPY